MNIHHNHQPHTAQYMLERLAERTPAVVERHRDKSSLIAAFAESLPANADDYRRQYVDVDRLVGEVHALGGAASDLVGALHATATGWYTPLLHHLGDDFIVPASVRNPVPSDVFNESERLLDRMRTIAAVPEQAPTYIEMAIGELESLITQTRAAFETWREAKVELQERRRALRERAVLFETELIAFRSILRRVVGFGHHDYQYLRTRRVRQELADERKPVPESDDVPEGDGVPEGTALPEDAGDEGQSAA